MAALAFDDSGLSRSENQGLHDDTPDNRARVLELFRETVNSNKLLSAMEIIDSAESYEDMIRKLRKLIGNGAS